MAQCAICLKSVSEWEPHPHTQQRSEFMKLLNAVGSDLGVYGCPACKCNDRDRHLWLYMRATGILDNIPQFKILHIAPEMHLEVLISNLAPVEYTRGDLFPKQVHHQQINVEDMQFEDEYFDLIICNHVLEHVSSPDKAISEFYRCLTPQGVLVAQTPYAPEIKHTLEMNRPVSPAFAKLIFGQDDHVRLFGEDITVYFHRAGFSGNLIPHDQVLPGVERNEFGINVAEPFFVFTK